MKSLIRRQSPALVIAVVALIAALGGTAVAGGAINKKKAKNIANNVVTQRAPGLSVSHANTANSANSASSANTANVANKVGPLSAANIDYRSTSGAPETTITTLDGLTLLGSCPADATLFRVNGNGGAFHSVGITDGAVAKTAEDTTLTTPLTINTGATNEEVGVIDYLTSAGAQVTMTYQTEDDADNFGTDCSISGQALFT
jgi:hypothetical protein